MLLFHTCKIAGERYMFLVEKQMFIPKNCRRPGKECNRETEKVRFNNGIFVLLFKVFTHLNKVYSMLIIFDTHIF